MGYAPPTNYTLTRGPFKSIDQLQLTVPDGAFKELYTINGAGIFYYAYIHAIGGVNSQKISVKPLIDRLPLHPFNTFETFEAFGFDADSKPVTLQNYNVDGFCQTIYDFPNGIKFDTQLRFEVAQRIGDAIQQIEVWFGYEEV